eukprot:7097013-Alexandrium_andersonii.AAC.1
MHVKADLVILFGKPVPLGERIVYRDPPKPLEDSTFLGRVARCLVRYTAVKGEKVLDSASEYLLQDRSGLVLNYAKDARMSGGRMTLRGCLRPATMSDRLCRRMSTDFPLYEPAAEEREASELIAGGLYTFYERAVCTWMSPATTASWRRCAARSLTTSRPSSSSSPAATSPSCTRSLPASRSAASTPSSSSCASTPA